MLHGYRVTCEMLVRVVRVGVREASEGASEGVRAHVCPRAQPLATHRRIKKSASF